VQTKLNEQGHNVGAVDGIMGPKTQKGLKDFQSAKGMDASGQLDQQTLSALGVSGSAAGGASASKSEKKAEGSAASGGSASTESKAGSSKSEGSAASGGSSAGASGSTSGAAGSSTTEQKPQQPPAPAKSDTKPGEKKY
jgi:peptidoglycan hydrolase-like protein with peptidoglycan-binding domain